MSERKTGFTIVTYKLRLYDRHHDWLINTRQIYNQVVWHYYQILMQEMVLLEQSSYLLLRKLEEMSVGTKGMKARGEEPLWKLQDIPKIPLYFRRAAINTAIGLAKSYLVSCNQISYSQTKRSPTEKRLSPATTVDCSPVFYKGMYREFHKNSIELKVYNGEKWVWVTYPYTGRKIPENGKSLSPILKVEKKIAYLYIPIELEVKDIRTVKERMKQENYICAVAFPDSDSLAVCAIMDRTGILTEVRFIHGGAIRDAQRQKVLKRLEKSRKSRQSITGTLKVREAEKVANRENDSLYKKLEQINQYYAHKVSREILDYCKEKQIKLIVVPHYKNTIPFRERAYLNTNQFHWQGRAIIRNLKYKSFKEGILVSTIPPYHITDCCSECGKTIYRYNEGHKASRNYYGGQLFFCPEGHKGSAGLNTAKNIGRYFLRYFQEEG